MLTSELYWREKSWDIDSAVATLRWIRATHVYNEVVAVVHTMYGPQRLFFVGFNLTALKDIESPTFVKLEDAKAYAYMTCLLTLKEIAHDAT
jgi:hypothetical protein